MSKFDSDEQLKALLAADLPHRPVGEQTRKALRRSRANVAQRDTLLFAFIKLWTTLAEMLAPLFAAFASKHVVRAKPARTKPITK
jgi:hypothetical protein